MNWSAESNAVFTGHGKYNDKKKKMKCKTSENGTLSDWLGLAKEL